MADEADVTFAFSPALAIQGLLDYTRADHAKIYKSAIREVSKEPFDCEADGLYQFLKDVQDRADEMGWSDSILRITLEVLDNGEAVQENLIENYGTITLEQVTESELQYINEQGREAQDTYMLYKCLMASLSSNAKKKVSIWSEQYQIGMSETEGGQTDADGTADKQTTQTHTTSRTSRHDIADKQTTQTAAREIVQGYETQTILQTSRRHRRQREELVQGYELLQSEISTTRSEDTICTIRAANSNERKKRTIKHNRP